SIKSLTKNKPYLRTKKNTLSLYKKRVISFIKDCFICSYSAQIASYPLMLYYFYNTFLLSILLNIITIIVLLPIVSIEFICIIIGPIVPYLICSLHYSNTFLIESILHYVCYYKNFSQYFSVMGKMSFCWVIGAYVIISLGIWLIKKKKKLVGFVVIILPLIFHSLNINTKNRLHSDQITIEICGRKRGFDCFITIDRERYYLSDSIEIAKKEITQIEEYCNYYGIKKNTVPFFTINNVLRLNKIAKGKIAVIEKQDYFIIQLTRCNKKGIIFLYKKNEEAYAVLNMTDDSIVISPVSIAHSLKRTRESMRNIFYALSYLKSIRLYNLYSTDNGLISIKFSKSKHVQVHCQDT
ncbi:ComEC/Rec2 family competence protein, partial [Chlamydiota bacterium]